MYKSNAKTTKPPPSKRRFFLTTKQFQLANNAGECPGAYINSFNMYVELRDFIDNCNKHLSAKREPGGLRFANGT